MAAAAAVTGRADRRARPAGREPDHVEAFTHAHRRRRRPSTCPTSTPTASSPRASCGSRGPGYEHFLFHDVRFDEDGGERPEFVLNQAPYRPARILVTAENFGCGSSREAAVWALARLRLPLRASARASATSSSRTASRTARSRSCCPRETARRPPPPAPRAARAPRITVDLAAQTITGPDGARHRLRGRSVPQAEPARRPGRDRAHAVPRGRDRGLRGAAQGGGPWLA